MRNVCIYCFGLIGLLALSQAAEPTALEKAVDTIALEMIEQDQAIGMSIGVARGDKTLLVKGYGLADVENQVPASSESVYRIGSITKMFTAAAILLLAEDGRLKLDDPITRFLPEFPIDKVTVRHLLNHTSGLVSFTDLPDYREKIRQDVTHDEIVDRFKDLPPHFAPGERYRYCNSGYYLLGMIIEIASEKEYEAFLVERIFDPLKLNASYYDWGPPIIPQRARGYNFWGGKLSNAPFNSMTQPFAAGALASTAGDLLKFNKALVSGQLLKKESRKEMIEPATLSNGKKSRYGLGCFIRQQSGEKWIGHGGSIVGFGCQLAWLPDHDLTIVVLGNSGGFPARKIAEQIVKKALD